MTLLKTVVLIFIVLPKCQSQHVGKLQIVSELDPQSCFSQDLKYVDDPIDSLPKCVDFSIEEQATCIEYNRPSSTLENKPTCAKKGDFGPIQCKGERLTGRCFCFDAQGNRIFGQQWWTAAQNMTCACSRKKADMTSLMSTEAHPNFYFNSLHCNNIGNYEALQCDVITGICWCADEKTGELTSPVVPDKAMSKLPCYSSIQTGSQYLRQCESDQYAQTRIVHELNVHGTQAHVQEFHCDDDGSFGAYRVMDDGSAYCTWKDNSNIGSWHTESTHDGLNCNCARDKSIFAEVGKKHTQKCRSDGNYEEYQKINKNTYCIDLDGYRKSPLDVQVPDPQNCTEYLAYH